MWRRPPLGQNGFVRPKAIDVLIRAVTSLDSPAYRICN